MRRAVERAITLGFIACSPVYSANIIYETNVVVETIAGSGFAGLMDGVGTGTSFNYPTCICLDSKEENLLVADSENGCVRRIHLADFAVTTDVGPGSPFAVGLFVENRDKVFSTADAPLGKVTSIAVDGLDRLYIDAEGAGIWWVTNSKASYFAGPLSQDQPGSSRLNTTVKGPLASDGTNLYVCGDNRIWKISASGTVSLILGSGNDGCVDGVGIFSSFTAVQGMTIAPNKGSWVLDWCGIRMATANLSLATVIKSTDILTIGADGTNSNIPISFGIKQIGASSDECFLPDGNRIRRFRLDGSATTVAGKVESGYADGLGNIAQFCRPLGVAVDHNGVVYVADTGNHRIRRITIGTNSALEMLPELTVHLFPGVTIRGVPGRFYRIESSLNPKNSPWRVETVLQLPKSPYLWMDPVAVTNPRKFYRVVQTE